MMWQVSYTSEGVGDRFEGALKFISLNKCSTPILCSFGGTGDLSIP